MLQTIDRLFFVPGFLKQDTSRVNRFRNQGLAVLLGSLCWIGWATPGFANPVDEWAAENWVELGTQVHGGFGSYIALGIRIGLDAKARLGAESRELDITSYSAATAPCPCVVDGMMIATGATPGQNSLRVAETPSPPETFGIVEVQHKTTGDTVRYLIPASARERLDEWNRNLDPIGRFNAVMNEPSTHLFLITETLSE